LKFFETPKNNRKMKNLVFQTTFVVEANENGFDYPFDLIIFLKCDGFS